MAAHGKECLFDLEFTPLVLFGKYRFSSENATPSTRHRLRVVQAHLE